MSITFKDTGHYWLLSKTGLLTWCIATMYKIKTCEILSSTGRRSCEIKGTSSLPQIVCDFGTSKSNSEVSESNSWKITSFSKTSSLQSEPFLTMCYFYHHQLLVTRYQVRYMLIIIYSNYQ